MPGPAVAAIAAIGSIGGAAYGAKKSGDAAEAAAGAQAESSALGVAEQRRQFNKLQQILAPYRQAGGAALQNYMTLSGLRGGGPQKRAIEALEAGPEFTRAMELGQENILSNAAATGGLRGGDTQRALAELGPDVLNSIINNQLNRSSGLITAGQNAATGTGMAGMNSANSISDLLLNSGNAQAQAHIAGGAATTGLINNIMDTAGSFAGVGLSEGWF